MVTVGFDLDQIFAEQPIGENENIFGFSSQPLETIPTQDLKSSNINEAHIRSVSEYQEKSSTDIPYSELFGRQVAKKDQLDTENTPFDFFEPSANELDSFEESDDNLPILKLPKIRSEKERVKKVKESEYFQERQEVQDDEVAEQDAPINFDKAFLTRLSNLKDGVLNENRNSVGVGMFYQTRVGSAGLDALDTFVLPSIDGHYFMGLSHHIYGKMNLINMSNGPVTGDALNRYGAYEGGNIESVNSLTEMMIGYEYKTESSILVGEFGTVPSPAISPEVDYTWRVEYATKSGKISVNIAYVNKSVKDSMLSRIGDQYYYKMQDDPETEDRNESFKYGSAVRGGVTKEGVEVGIKHANNGEIFAGNMNYFYDIKGYHIIPNEEIALTLLYLRVLEIKGFKSFMIGPIFLYDNYAYNSGYFTMGSEGEGNGGYFSPKNFLLLGIYFDMAQIYSNKMFWKLKGNVGVMNFSSGKDIFDSTSKEASVSGYGYDVKAFIGYKLDDSIQLLGGIGYQSSGPFKSLFFGLTAIYYFGEKKSNEIGDLLYSNTLGEMAR